MEIVEVKNKKQKEDFIMFPFKLYKNDPLWVPLLISDMKKIIDGSGSLLFQNGPHTFLLAYEGKEVVGRLAVGIDEKLNNLRNKQEGYITLFECINDQKVAFKLFDTAILWLKDKGINYVSGFVSPTNGDDFRGMLIENFQDPPLIYTTYNPPYYVDLFENYGFKRDHVFLAFKYNLKSLPLDKAIKIIEYAKKKYGFITRPADYSKLEREAKALQYIIERAEIPIEYDYLIPPTEEEMLSLAKELKKFIPPNFVQMAWIKDEPVGFAVAIPDYNQILNRLKGRLFPFGLLKFLWYKRKINRARVFLAFVLPEHQSKGIPAALFVELLKYARSLGYDFAEGSTININNTKMCKEAESAGGIPYKKFAIYGKNI
ncbi:MAG: GNAT family N-acetyltransferase [Dictyoglomaceae bacterium]|nr:GNAT family N-acetyltransferase [Dictyoglomaceae bacterium]